MSVKYDFSNIKKIMFNNMSITKGFYDGQIVFNPIDNKKEMAILQSMVDGIDSISGQFTAQSWPGFYTQANVDIFTPHLNAAKTVLTKKDASKKQVQDAIDDLATAYATLQNSHITITPGWYVIKSGWSYWEDNYFPPVYVRDTDTPSSIYTEITKMLRGEFVQTDPLTDVQYLFELQDATLETGDGDYFLYNVNTNRYATSRYEWYDSSIQADQVSSTSYWGIQKEKYYHYYWEPTTPTYNTQHINYFTYGYNVGKWLIKDRYYSWGTDNYNKDSYVVQSNYDSDTPNLNDYGYLLPSVGGSMSYDTGKFAYYLIPVTDQTTITLANKMKANWPMVEALDPVLDAAITTDAEVHKGTPVPDRTTPLITQCSSNRSYTDSSDYSQLVPSNVRYQGVTNADIPAYFIDNNDTTYMQIGTDATSKAYIQVDIHDNPQSCVYFEYETRNATQPNTNQHTWGSQERPWQMKIYGTNNSSYAGGYVNNNNYPLLDAMMDGTMTYIGDLTIGNDYATEPYTRLNVPPLGNGIDLGTSYDYLKFELVSNANNQNYYFTVGEFQVYPCTITGSEYDTVPGMAAADDALKLQIQNAQTKKANFEVTQTDIDNLQAALDAVNTLRVTPYEFQYLTFEALTAGTITPTRANTNVSPISYSTDDGSSWTEISGTSEAISVNTNDKVLFKCDRTSDTFNSSNIIQFGYTCDCNVYGNPMSMIYGDNFYTISNNTKVPVNTLAGKICAFYKMFYMSTANNRIKDISNIKLPATTLAKNCYQQMFRNCQGITTAPELPATTLANNCYQAMFYNCSGLTTAPALPAPTVVRECYTSMFYGCSSLTTAPDLNAPRLYQDSYKELFKGCSSLNYIKCLATNISASGCTTNWTDGVAATGTFVSDHNTPWTSGVSGIPSGWTNTNI